MTVRFLCPACNQLLGIAARKIGAQVNCPKCQATIIVPAPLEPAMKVGTESLEAPPEDALTAIVADDRPAPANNSPSATSLLHDATENSLGDPSMLLISRRVL